MEITKANTLARDVASYIRKHPRTVELEQRVRHITHGHDLDEADTQQVTRIVRRLLFDDKRWGPRGGVVRCVPRQRQR